MNAKLASLLVLLTGMTTFGHAAVASDELAGAVIGGGAGALIGHAIDRHDGAVVGGILGAVLGVAIADNDDDDRRYRTVVVRRPPPPPVVVYQAVPVRYVAQPVYVRPYPPVYPGWREHRHDDHGWRSHGDKDWDDRHDGRRGRDRDDDRDHRGRR